MASKWICAPPYRKILCNSWPLLLYFGYLTIHVVASPLLAIHSLRRARKRGHSKIAWTRLLGGSKPPRSIPDGDRWTILYAAGMGEKRAGFDFAEVIAQERSSSVAVLTQAWNASRITHARIESGIMPYNNPISVLIFLFRWRPKAILGVEFWDNTHLAAICLLLGIRTAVFNCPITESAVRLIKGRSRWRYHFVLAYFCQSSDQVRRLHTGVGIPAVRLVNTGPTCIAVDPVQGLSESPDAVRNRLKSELGLGDSNFPVIVAGSTYKDEELILLEAFAKLRRTFPFAALILAPRGLTRPGGCDSALKESKIAFNRRTIPGSQVPDSGVFLLDTTGELKYFYSLATVAYVGGSMDKQGTGHTPIEAMAWGVPVSIGPTHPQQKFILRELLRLNAAKICEDADELAQFWCDVAKDAAYRDNVQRSLANWLADSDEMILKIYDHLIAPT